MSELMPCPFCGGGASLYEEIPGGYIVQCHDCCGQIGIMRKDKAIAAWNARAWTVADNDAEVLGDVTLGLFRDLMAVDPETAKLWARSWPEIFASGNGESETPTTAAKIEAILRDYGIECAHDLNADPDATISEGTIKKYVAKLQGCGKAVSDGC